MGWVMVVMPLPAISVDPSARTTSAVDGGMPIPRRVPGMDISRRRAVSFCGSKAVSTTVPVSV